MISVVVFIFRICTNNEQKYSRLLFTELILTVLRIPPVAYSARSTVVYKHSLGLLPRFGFGVFLINLSVLPYPILPFTAMMTSILIYLEAYSASWTS